jgi:type I restriction enzyme S subunit
MESMKNHVGMSWEMVRLGDVLDYEQPTNYIVKSDLYDNKFKTPVLTAGKSFILGYTDETDGIFSKLPVIIFDDFTTVSKYVDFPFKVKSSAMKILKAKEGVADTRYMFYLLQTLNLDCEQHKRYWISKFAPFQIPLPPLPIQKRIAEILDAADALKRKDQALLKKYDELAQAIFIDMFGDPVKNEKGWEVKTIGSLTSVGSGGTPSRQEPSYFEGEIPWVKTTEVNGEMINSTEETISQSGLKNSSCKIYPKNSVLIAMYGQGKTRGQVGILGVEATTNQACAVISPCKSLNPIFLFNYLKLSYKELRSLGRGGNQENLNKGIIEDFHVIVPPMKTQTKFNGLIDNIKHQQIKAAEGKSNSLFQALIQKAFKGELVAE